MKIVDILSEDSVIPALTSKNKKAVIEELVSVLVNKDERLNKEELIEVFLERERLGSTGIGGGIAIPHGKLGSIDMMLASFGRSLEGVDFESTDGTPTHIFFLLIAPENSAGTHLKALARISRLLKDDSFRKSLMHAKSKKEIFENIIERDEQENHLERQ